MGKRELLIIIAFVAVGALAYQLTAPAPKEGESGFSISKIFSGIRNEIRSHAASANVTTSGAVALRPGVTEIRLNAMRSMPVTVIGEKRTDIAYELFVQSDGPDEATAKDWATRSKLVDDDLGTAQAFSVSFPKQGNQTGKLSLRVPEQLLTRIEGGGRAIISDVRAVDLRNMSGELTLTNIASAVTGSHRGGDLTITSAGGVTLALASSRAKLSEIKGAINLNGRSGSCAVANSKGPLEAVVTNVDLTITDHAGSVRVTGENGMVRLARPTGDVSIDVRRAPVEVTLGDAVAAAIITTDETLRLTLAGPPSVSIDALVNESGSVRAPELGLDPATTKENKLTAPVGAGGPRVVLRNTRADIVIAVRK